MTTENKELSARDKIYGITASKEAKSKKSNQSNKKAKYEPEPEE